MYTYVHYTETAIACCAVNDGRELPFPVIHAHDKV